MKNMSRDSSFDVDQRVQRELELPSSWSNDDLDVDPSDQGTIFRNASEETSATHSTATHLVRMIWTLALETSTSVMRVGMRLTHSITALLLTETQGCSLHADSKTRVTIEYVQRAGGSVEAKENSQCVQFSSSQHTEPLNAVQSTRSPGIQVPTRVSPSWET